MVAIKIQSLDDIVRAYLENLGFRGRRLEDNTGQISAMLGPEFNPYDVSSSLDNLIYGFARKIFKGKNIDKEQKIALFKFCFMECGGADKWGAEMFGARTVPVEIIKEMRSKAIEIVPPYQMSKMLPQVIETPEQLLGKILHHKKD